MSSSGGAGPSLRCDAAPSTADVREQMGMALERAERVRLVKGEGAR